MAIKVLSPYETFAGLTRGSWSAHFWRYLFSVLPKKGEAHPDDNQSGIMYFLGGKYAHGFEDPWHVVRAGEECHVRAGNAIMIPITKYIATSFDGDGEKFSQLLTAVRTIGDPSRVYKLTLAVNGEPVTDLRDYYTESELFDIDIPGSLTYSQTSTHAVSAGHFVIIKPEAGEYKINYSATYSIDYAGRRKRYSSDDSYKVVVAKEADKESSSY